MKIIPYLVGCLFILLTACNTPTEPKQADDDKISAEEKKNTEKPKQEEKSDPNVFEVKEACLLFLNPSSAAFDKAKEAFVKEHGKEALAEVGSDIGFYQMGASDFAESKGLKVLNSNLASVHFKKEDGTVFKLKNNVAGMDAEAYMFDGKKDPLKVKELVSFPTGEEYKAYFEGQ